MEIQSANNIPQIAIQVIQGNVPSKPNCYKIPDSQIAEAYAELQNVWKVGERVGLSGQTIHKRLADLGLINKMNYFTDSDISFLKANYKQYRDRGDLRSLAVLMKRTVPFINRKAKVVGLTEPGKSISMKPFAVAISKARKKYYQTNEHPRGMKGKTHSDEFRVGASLRSTAMWADPQSKFNSQEFRQLKSDMMSNLQASGKLANNYTRTKNGTVNIDGKVYHYRSSWEVNIAAYLQFQKENDIIVDWEYETDVFWFEKIKRGVRSYKPDFKITRHDGSQYFIEVKGWMDPKSKTKLSRMKLYHPSVEIEVIDSKRYNSIKKSSALIRYWGALDSDQHCVKFIRCSIDGCENKNHSKDVCRKHFYKIYGK